MKNLVFIFDEEFDKSFLEVGSKEEVRIICENDTIKTKVLNFGYDCKTITDYLKDINYNQKALEWIKNWPDKKLIENKNFKELFVYENQSLFWFLETRLYLYRIKELIMLIEGIRNSIKTENPQKIWINGSNDVKKIISQILPSSIQKFESKSKSKRTITQKSYQGFPILKLSLLKIFRGFRSPKNKKISSSGKILIITEVSNWRKDFDYTLKKYISKDVFFHDIIKKLKELSHEILVIDFENRPRKLLRARSLNQERRKSLGVRVEPWEKYTTLDLIKKSKEVNQKILDRWEFLKNSKNFQESLVYDGISIYDLINQDIDYLFKSFKAFTAITLIETAKKIIEVEKPSVIVMYDEYGALQIAIIKAAKDKGIPTISLQHGLIPDNILPYFHYPEHINNENQSVVFPLPDKMCVWSESSKKNLIEIGNFSSSIPVITGDPKVDFLPKAKKSFDYEKIRGILNINNNKKIILFATENLPNKEEREIVAKSVISKVKDFQNCHLIIKPHPNESDISIYENLISENKLSDVSILRDVNLYEMLYISDLVILSYSTVGVEAMRMEKPVISLDLLGLHNDALIIKNNAAIVVRNSDYLSQAIQKCLDTNLSKDLIEKGKKLAEQELGILDGLSTERVIDQILQLKNQK